MDKATAVGVSIPEQEKMAERYDGDREDPDGSTTGTNGADSNKLTPGVVIRDPGGDDDSQ